MATAAVARPAQTLRRREAARSSLAKRPTLDGGEPASKKRKLSEPFVRDDQYILRKHKGKPPSLIIHLHPTHFRFDGQDGSFAYDSPMRTVLQHLRKQTVPHEMLEELLAANVPFYDGCLIVEVHNHRSADAKQAGQKDAVTGEDTKKFSMHNYNEHVTPSPMVPYPSQAQAEAEASRADESGNGEMAAPDKAKDKDGPTITTVVLHSTAQARHEEMLILATTPASELRSKKKGSDAGTPATAQPPTPQLSVPPTPSASKSPVSGKMALEPADLYTFQADMLVATGTPLYLQPASDLQESQRVLDMLAHPLHSEKPPSPKERKRTTAEMAADDAQAAEAERRMLIMDERIKPSGRAGAGAATTENQAAAASLGFSRFKTLEMVRQKHEEQERARKEDEFEKRQAEEQAQAKHNAQRQRQMLIEQQQVRQRQQQITLAQQQETARQMQAQINSQQQVNGMQNHAHPQQSGMMPSQQGNLQQPGSGIQASPVIRQQTPMVNSSPMMPNSDFPMAQTTSQGVGSPPRPTSAAMQHPNVAMARVQSQQQGSRNNTPQIPQGTPAMPNRQMAQTPRVPPGSPAPGMQQGTPNSMMMHTPHMNQGNPFTPEQIAIMRNQQNNMQHAVQAGSPAGKLPNNMTPEQFQLIKENTHLNEQRKQARIMAQQAAQQGNAPVQQQAQARIQAIHQRQQILQQQMRHVQMQMGSQQGQASSPMGGTHPTPQMGHSHPGQTLGMHPQQSNMGQQDPNMHQQQAMAQAQAQQRTMQQRQFSQQLAAIAQQNGGFIPPHIAAQLPAHLQQHLANTKRQQGIQAQARAQAAHQAAIRSQHPVGDVTQPQQYMQNLRNLQMQMGSQMAAQTPGGTMVGANPQMNMGGMGMPQQFAGQQPQPPGNSGDLSQQFAAMQNVLARAQSQGQGM